MEDPQNNHESDKIQWWCKNSQGRYGSSVMRASPFVQAAARNNLKLLRWTKFYS